MLKSYTIEGFENIQYQGFKPLKNIENRLNDLFRLYGYHQVATPTFEAYDLYAEEDAIPADDLFKLVNRKGKVLALKPDATLPVARMAAINHHDSGEIIKFYYETNIYRNFSASDDTRKEITQMGVEYFGDRRPECDVEIIALAVEALSVNNIEDIQIDLGHVGFINALLDELDLTKEERKHLTLLIDNKNIGDIHEFLSDHKIGGKIGRIISKLPMLYGNPADVFDKMEALCINDRMRDAVRDLKCIYRQLGVIGLDKYVTFDLGFTSAMNYYSGMVFKAYVGNWGTPVIDGGRYDTMSVKFGIDRPACGFAIDILTLMDFMEQHDLLPKGAESSTVILYAPDDKAQAYRLCRELHSRGVIAEMFLVKGTAEAMIQKLGAQALYHTARFFCVRDGDIYQWQQHHLEHVPGINGMKGDKK